LKDELLTEIQVADYLQMSLKQVGRLIGSGELRAYVTKPAIDRLLERTTVVDHEAYRMKQHPEPRHEKAVERHLIEENVTNLYNGPAVYFLWQGEDVVYVGQTTLFWERVGRHCQEKSFDRISYIRCEKEDLLAMERAAIYKYRPKLNKTCS
jgi:hypothetical protein